MTIAEAAVLIKRNVGAIGTMIKFKTLAVTTRADGTLDVSEQSVRDWQTARTARDAKPKRVPKVPKPESEAKPKREPKAVAGFHPQPKPD